MEFNNKQINVKESQNIIEVSGIGSFKFVEHTDKNPVTCWDCDVNCMGICAVVPCSMAYRSDYKDGVFQSLNK